jgi:hypothetical protein
VPRTEVVTVTKLEIVEVPAELTALCLIPDPPLDADGNLRYEVLPEYLGVVIGVLEECNTQLLKIQSLP